MIRGNRSRPTQNMKAPVLRVHETPDEARARFLWHLADPLDIIRAATTKELRREAGRKLGVSERTILRRRSAYVPCPGPRCMTNVRGGGLCSFCRRTEELSTLEDRGGKLGTGA